MKGSSIASAETDLSDDDIQKLVKFFEILIEIEKMQKETR